MISKSRYYIWSEKDVLGTGATSNVYTGRSQTDGRKVAVKVFNNSSFMRPGEVQDREFEVLKQLKHRNVVQLLAIDIEERSQQRVIVMELCSKGSLLTMLDQPEFMFGVPEQEYKRILGDICSGMKYLKSNDIVHRDLKPGNIMVVEDAEGQNIYKLADFGAARKLANDENFVSLYGTEEYLHPDMYARALLSQMCGTAFNSSVDLWSLGVTLYHVATGSLPFRPFGGRNNKQTMHYLTTRKESGVICGFQKDSANGPIEWERELPENTRMSTMFKKMLTPLLAGLMECDQTKMMSAEKFFENVDRILDMNVYDLFDVQTGRMLKIYLKKDDTFDVMKEHVKELSGVKMQDQMILYEGQIFKPVTSCKQFPSTTEKNPMLLFSKTLDAFESISYHTHKHFPQMSSNSHPDTDYSYAKTSAGVMCFKKLTLQSTLIAQQAFTLAFKSFKSVMEDYWRQADRKMADVACVKVKVITNLEALKDHLNFVHTLEGALQVDAGAEQGNSMKITEIEALVNEIQEDNDNSILELNDLSIELKKQSNSFEIMDDLCCNPGQRCCERFKVYLISVFESLEIFKKNRRSKQRESSSILRLEILRLRDFCDSAKNYQQQHCEEKLKDVHSKFSDWYKQSHLILEKVEKIKEKVKWFEMKYEDLQHNILKVKQDLEKKQDVLLTNFKSLTTKELEKVNPSSVTSIASSGSNPSLASDFEVINSSMAASIPEDENVGVGFIPNFLKKLPGRQITVNKDIKQHILIKEASKGNDNDPLSESMKLIEMLGQQSAGLFSDLNIPTATDDLKQ